MLTRFFILMNLHYIIITATNVRYLDHTSAPPPPPPPLYSNILSALYNDKGVYISFPIIYFPLLDGKFL